MTPSDALAATVQYLPFGLTPADALALVAGVAMTLTIFGVWKTLKVGDPLTRRLRDLSRRQAVLRAQMLEPPRRKRRRPVATGMMHAVVRRLDLLRSKHAAEAQLMLTRAGFRSEDAMVRYLFYRLTLPTLLGLLVAADAYWVRVIPIGQSWRALASCVGVVAGLYAPQVYLKNAVAKRYQRISRSMPDGLDLMVICAEAGLSLDASLQRVSRELGKSWPELAEELTTTSIELTFLPDRRRALSNLMQRVDLVAVRGVVNTLQQTEKFGTPLVNALRVLAAEFRDQRMFKAEEKAARLSVLLTLPMIIFIMPALFIVLLGPAALNILDVVHHHPHH